MCMCMLIELGVMEILRLARLLTRLAGKSGCPGLRAIGSKHWTRRRAGEARFEHEVAEGFSIEHLR